ncbi:unnamed protein product, partial [Meganyctiphanes norvegica]
MNMRELPHARALGARFKEKLQNTLFYMNVFQGMRIGYLSLEECRIVLSMKKKEMVLITDELPFDKRSRSLDINLAEHGKMFLENQGQEEKQRTLGVLGSGDYGRAIAGRLAQAGYTVLVGSRNPNNQAIRTLLDSKPGTRLVSQEAAAEGAGILVVAVPSDHYSRLPLHALKGKILIDVANNTKMPKPDEMSQAEILQQLVPLADVVKSFNVLSAYALENNVNQAAKQVPVASDSPRAKKMILELLKELNYTAVDYGSLEKAREIECIPLRFLPSWKIPFIVVAILWCLHFLLLLLKFQLCETLDGNPNKASRLWRHLGLLNINRATAITALWTLTLCYIPGVIAAYTQLVWGTKYRRFPNWLDKWLRMRKQLGLLMLGLGAIHTILGTAVWSSKYDPLIWDKPTVIKTMVKFNSSSFTEKEVVVQNSLMNLQGELFITFGCASMFLTCLLGITSLPSVGATLTWREFMFIQSKLGWMALLTGVVHDGVLGWGFSPQHYTLCSLPSGAQYALHPPLLTVILKLPLLIPWVDNALQTIRRGHDRKKRRGRVKEHGKKQFYQDDFSLDGKKSAAASSSSSTNHSSGSEPH